MEARLNRAGESDLADDWRFATDLIKAFAVLILM
jgi:hypothetical protein